MDTDDSKLRETFRQAFYSNDGAGQSDREKMLAAYDIAIYTEMFGHSYEAHCYRMIANFYFDRHRAAMQENKSRLLQK